MNAVYGWYGLRAARSVRGFPWERADIWMMCVVWLLCGVWGVCKHMDVVWCV